LALSHIEQITILNHTFNKNYKQLKKNKNNINICVNLDGRYAYKLIVSMESVLSNCDKQKTFITYHILCAPDVRENSLIILKSLMKRYSLNLEMVFYGMGYNFMYLKHTRLSQVTYYRLLLPLFINSDRILYLDGDTITYKDISVIFQLDFNGTYVLGTLDYKSNGVDYLGLKSEKYINAGVILINLEKIRKDKKYYDLINITKYEYLKNHDQTVLNYVLYPKIGIIPNKYISFNFHDKLDIEFYAKLLRQKLDVKELVKLYKDPTIIHYCLCSPKIWIPRTEYHNLL
jgi:lipopolysaccharide biosynthesis glycosyltransferase